MEKILVVDDDKEIVRLVTSYLETAGYSVISAYDGETALHQLRAEEPDLVVLDLMLPDRDGWDITRLVRGDRRLSSTPIIMLTARVEDSEKIVGLEIGADDYITKPFNPREVVARVRALLRRSQADFGAAGQVVYRVGDLQLDVDRRVLTRGELEIDLTPSEFDLMEVLMGNPGFVYTRDELVEKALGYSYEGMGRTLDTHIKNLRKKIEQNPKDPDLIQTVYGIGYRFRGEKA